MTTLTISAMDHLVYQNDNCRIFHCTAEQHYEDIKACMRLLSHRNQGWVLVSETNHKQDTWLIYLRK
jgi:hypothetical protein